MEAHPTNPTAAVVAARLGQSDLFPLSLAQQQIWVAQLAAGVTPIYNLVATFHIHGQMDSIGDAIDGSHKSRSHSESTINAEQFQLACEAVVASSDVLQTVFIEQSPAEVFQFRNNSIKAECKVVQLGDNESLTDWSKREAGVPLNLKEKCFRFCLLVLPDNTSVFHFSIHHLIADGGVLENLWQKISDSYHHTQSGSTNRSAPVLYCQHVAAQQNDLDSNTRRKNLDYWHAKAANARESANYYGLTAKPGYLIHRTYWQPNACELAKIHAALKLPAFNAGSQNKSLFVLLATVLMVTASKAQTNPHQRLGFPSRSRKERAFRNALGVFISVGFLDIDIEKLESVASLAGKIKADLDDSLHHLDSSVQSARITRAFNTSLNIILAKANRFGSLPVTTVARTNGFSDSSSEIDLHITDFSGNGDFVFMFDMATAVFSNAEQSRYINHYRNALDIVTSQADAKLADISILSTAEKNNLLTLGSGALPTPLQAQTIHHQFDHICEVHSDGIALIQGSSQFTFAQVKRRADALATAIRQHNPAGNRTVAVQFERSVAATISILAVLKSGLRFLPLDSAYPIERQQFMVSDSGAQLLLKSAALDTQLNAISSIDVNTDGQVVSTEPLSKPVSAIAVAEMPTGIPSDAYLMYTSGSTGEPKAIVGTHAATLNRLQWMWQRYPFKHHEVCAAKTAISFVDSIWELFGPLLKGCPTVVFSEDDVLDIFRFCEKIEQAQVTRLVLVPSLLSVLLDSDEQLAEHLSKLEQVVVSGEPLSSELTQRFFATLPNTNLVNLYGSTEVSADITFAEITHEQAAGKVPIGRPIDGVQILLLNEHLQLVPYGCVGEICVSGSGLSGGYHQRENLQTVKFIANPYGNGLLFKTGDLGRYRDDGQLEHHGRNDLQMKRFGQRFEASEIEHHALQLAGVNRCVAGINGDSALFVCYEHETESIEQQISIKSELETHLQQQLPAYLQPDILLGVSTLPVLPNGKLDRAATAELSLSESGFAANRFEPISESETTLLSIWHKVLGIENIDLTQDFFAIGGNSVAAMRIVVDVRNAGYQLELSDILQIGSIRKIAVALKKIPETRNSGIAQGKAPSILEGKSSADNAIKPQADTDSQSLLAATEFAEQKNALVVDPNARFVPDTISETNLLAIWQQVLKRRKIDLRADFFQVGGNSIAAMQIMVAAKKAGIRLALRDIVELGSIEGLARKIEHNPDALIPMENSSVFDKAVTINSEQHILGQLHTLGFNLSASELDWYPLSGSQKGILFHMMMFGLNKPLYVAQGRADLIGNIDPMLFEQAWQYLVQRHDALRTIVLHDNLLEPVQVVLPSAKQNWHFHDLSTLNEKHKLEQRDAIASNSINHRIDLQVAPLLRTTLIKMSATVFHFVVDFHHIMLDGWSAASLGEELALVYKALAKSEQPALGDCGQFKLHVASVQSLDTRSSNAFWKKKLAGFQQATSISAIRAQSEHYATGNHRLLLDEDTTSSINALAMQCRVTPNTLIQAAWAILLSRRHHTEDVLYGFAVTGRSSGIQNYESAVGMFVNSLPMRVQCNGALEIKPFLQQLQGELLSLLEYENSSLVDIQQVSELDSHSSLFDSLLVFQNVPAPWDDPSMPYQIRNRHNHENSHIPLTIEVFPESELRVLFLYVPQYCSAKQISSVAAQFRAVLESMAGLGVNGLVADIARPSQDELKTRTTEYNQTQMDYDASRPWSDLIWEQARQTPDAIAASFNQSSLSYSALTQQAQRLANYLHSLGIGPGKLVGVCQPRSMEMLVSLLGVARSGAAYIPIDPEYPSDRISHIISDSALEHIVCPAHFKLAEIDSHIVAINLYSDRVLTQSSSHHQQSQPRSDQVAYMIYTSGSTGLPKGVKVSQQNISNFLLSMRQKPGMQSHDALLAVTTISFDISVLELFLPLICGARVDIAPQEMVYDSFALAERIKTQSISCMQATPTTWRLLMAAGWQGGDAFKCLVGGEAFPRDLCQALLPITAELWNMYGPTETTVWSSCARIENANSVISIGRPIGNTEILVLEADGSLCPINKPGELVIAGDGLSLGYHNRDDLTAEKFTSHPFSPKTRQKIFRTGDLARWLDNGELECLGRMDRQVKLHGHRVEPGEIETVLHHIDGVKHAVVVFHKTTLADRLIAYVVLENVVANSDFEAQLRDTLRQKLPEYMVPAAILSIDTVPLLPNGKVDNASLPNPFEHASDDGIQARQLGSNADDLTLAANQPSTNTEKMLSKLFQKALQLDHVSINSNFFDIGGNSLIAMQIVADCVRHKLSLQLPQIFELATINMLASHIDEQNLEPIGNETTRKPGTDTEQSHSEGDMQRIAALLNRN